MKIVHWSRDNGSGLHRVAAQCVASETASGLASAWCSPDKPESWDAVVDADVHVVHAGFPDAVRSRLTKPLRTVFVAHGTPEHVYELATESAAKGGYGHSDTLMTLQHWLRAADARVTFWERHAAIYRTMLPRESVVDCLPMGVDKTFWSAGATRGKWDGKPSVLTRENPHRIKWPLDLFLLWPWVLEQVPEATLHAPNTPHNQHRHVFPLVNANGTAHRAHVSPMRFNDEDTRNALRSVDFHCGFVRYGDHNCTSMEAAAVGTPCISYRGNPYAHFWITEGDQREMAKELVAILRGETKAREVTPVPDAAETHAAMVRVYERICARVYWSQTSAPPERTPFLDVVPKQEAA